MTFRSPAPGQSALVLLFTVLGWLAAGGSLRAQDDERAQLEERYQAKLAEPFAKKIPWVRRISDAEAQARREKKLILAYFTLSYPEEPSEPCRTFEEGALVSDWWAEVSKKFVPYLNISARLADKPDQGLLLEKEGAYFPYFIVMDENGRRLVELRPFSRAAVEQALADARLRQRLLRESETGENVAAVRSLRLLRLILREIDLETEEIDRLAKTKGLDPALLARLGEFRAMKAVQDAFEDVQKVMRIQTAESENARQAARKEAQRRLADAMYALLVKGVEFKIETNPSLYINYAIFATKGALSKKDGKRARLALDRIAKAEAAVVPRRDRKPDPRRPGQSFREKIGFAELEKRVVELEKAP